MTLYTRTTVQLPRHQCICKDKTSSLTTLACVKALTSRAAYSWCCTSVALHTSSQPAARGTNNLHPVPACTENPDRDSRWQILQNCTVGGRENTSLHAAKLTKMGIPARPKSLMKFRPIRDRAAKEGGTCQKSHLLNNNQRGLTPAPLSRHDEAMCCHQGKRAVMEKAYHCAAHAC